MFFFGEKHHLAHVRTYVRCAHVPDSIPFIIQMLSTAYVELVARETYRHAKDVPLFFALHCLCLRHSNRSFQICEKHQELQGKLVQ